MSETNWELVQFKYEVLGIPLEELAREYNLSLPVLKFNSRDWKQLPLALKEPLDLKGLTSLEDVLTKLGEETGNQTKAFGVLKQKFLGPKYVELETVLLYKAIEMAQELKANDSRGASTLRSLANVLTDLLANNPLLAPDREMEGSENSREWKITVVDSSADDNGGSA